MGESLLLESFVHLFVCKRSHLTSNLLQRENQRMIDGPIVSLVNICINRFTLFSVSYIVGLGLNQIGNVILVIHIFMFTSER